MQKISKSEAARVLADELSNIRTAATRANYLAQEITDEYFYKHDPHDEKDQFCILYDFPRREAFAGLLEMCVFAIEAALDKIDEARKEGGTDNGEAQS